LRVGRGEMDTQHPVSPVRVEQERDRVGHQAPRPGRDQKAERMRADQRVLCVEGRLPEVRWLIHRSRPVRGVAELLLDATGDQTKGPVFGNSTGPLCAMARGPLPLPVSLDPAASLPLHVQLREGLRAAILDRRLPRGTRLPASRVLAADLGCARGTVVLALEQLTAEGYLTARPHGSPRPRLRGGPRTRDRIRRAPHGGHAADGVPNAVDWPGTLQPAERAA